MSIAADVKKLVAEFESENPKLRNKAYLTSGSRTWEEQLDIILDPKRSANYLNIKGRFKAKFKLEVLPKKLADLDKDQLAWWKAEIMKQAGKSPGFPHVGGKAQDVSVKNLTLEDKKKLKTKIETKFKILLEKVTGTTSQYGVAISSANVFHVYK